MLSCELEFRGINREHLGMYFEELGGKLVTESFPFLYKGDCWSGEILQEKEISFTPVFKVNCVYVKFSAADEQSLNELIKNYRYKTTRVGG